MKVRAIKLGYYGHLRRREGVIFELKQVEGLDSKGKPHTFTEEEQFSDKWMEKLDTEEVQEVEKEEKVLAKKHKQKHGHSRHSDTDAL